MHCAALGPRRLTTRKSIYIKLGGFIEKPFSPTTSSIARVESLELQAMICSSRWSRRVLTASSLHPSSLLPCHVKLSIPQSGQLVEISPCSSATAIYGRRSGHDTRAMSKSQAAQLVCSPPSRAANPHEFSGGCATDSEAMVTVPCLCTCTCAVPNSLDANHYSTVRGTCVTVLLCTNPNNSAPLSPGLFCVASLPRASRRQQVFFFGDCARYSNYTHCNLLGRAALFFPQ